MLYQLGYGSPESMLQYDLVLISCQSSSATVLIEKLLISFLNVSWHGFGEVMLLFSFLKIPFLVVKILSKFQFFKLCLCKFNLRVFIDPGISFLWQIVDPAIFMCKIF